MNPCDSICPRYWFVHYNKVYQGNADYDFKVTIIRGAYNSEDGLITAFARGDYFPDTLSCDSLGFAPYDIYSVDTVRNDTTTIYWNYLRPTKRLIGAILQPQVFSNHFKILLTSDSRKDSIVLSREFIELSRIKRGPPIRNTFNVPVKSTCSRACDIRGRRLISGIYPRGIIIVQEEGNTGNIRKTVFISGK